MRTMLAVLMALAFSCSVAMAVQGTTDQIQSDPTATTDQTAKTLTATVQSVNENAMSVSVKDDQGNIKLFVLGPETQIMKEKKAGKLADIAVGDSVKLWYTGTGANAKVQKLVITKMATK